MEDAIVLYASTEHLNSMLILATLTAKHHPSVSIIIISAAPTDAVVSVAAVPSITYHPIPSPVFPPNLTVSPVERFFEISRLQNPVLLQALQQISQKSKIRAFVMDFFCNSAFEVSRSLNLPTYYYISNGGYGLCVLLYISTIDKTMCEDIGNSNQFVEIPGCPSFPARDFPGGLHFRATNGYKYFLSTSINMPKSDGIVVNSFDALELKAKQALTQHLCTPDTKTPPVFYVGPLIAESSCNTSKSEHECVKWLNLQPKKTVIYLSFGRRGLFSAEQLMEMARGLENSGHRFIWAVRNPRGTTGVPALEDFDLNSVLPDGFLERTKDRGFVIKSWAPQRDILGHASVVGFVTHCGRSSVLEALSVGVPMIGWPMYAEQNMSRTFMVEDMKVALPLDMKADGFVMASELERRIRELVESETGKAVRRRVAEIKAAAAAAVVPGGSSVADLDKFIRHCFN